MRVTETFVDRFELPAPPEVVYAHLAEPENTVGLSPLIVTVREVRREAGVTRFVAVERFRLFGPLRYDNILRVTSVEEDPPRRLVWRVESPGWVSVGFVTDLAPGEDGATTVATMTVTLRMPRPLRGYVVRTARRVQRERAAVLADRMSRRTT